MSEADLDQYVARWVHWCNTRRLLAPGVKSNILARLQPAKVRTVEPDALMDASMPHFNAAIHGLCEQGGDEEAAAAFLGVYWYAVNIKALAREQKCARGTVYNRARRFARQAIAMRETIRKVHESMTAEKCSISVEHHSACMD
ncbi:hypothetical protein AB1286_29980 [Trinickia sp. NRRL B-1857]|uniref:hypothetical protein n=1 Tax=Trinickia sp. NRRL B-1857 TaxID=3162879 RepID=UPI003D2A62F0